MDRSEIASDEVTSFEASLTNAPLLKATSCEATSFEATLLEEIGVPGHIAGVLGRAGIAREIGVA